MGKTFRCPSCGEPVHVDYLEYDDYGAGCPHCGGHISQQQLTNLTRKENTNA
jgi:predicted RNA-binding Zn-ribbon protein involved in translation (DUF1610 family)